MNHMKKKWHLITAVEPGSVAEDYGLEPGDHIGRINGCIIEDIFDYQYQIDEEVLELEILTKDGKRQRLRVVKEDGKDLGLSFSSFLMDDYHSCSNRCLFCFIDQMPPGMRETLYFKDDDSRLSFLQGNYITLTNMKEYDLERVICYHMMPINISVHTTNPALRCKMLHNRFAGDVLEKIRQLYEAEISMNGQIVLCKGINDGAELDRTIGDLSGFLPYMESLSVVPVGLTKYRDGLFALSPFKKEEAEGVLDQIEAWQEKLKREKGSYFVHASDEWYLLADRPFPEEERYEEYRQLENGVGMMRLFINEVEKRLSELTGDGRRREVSIATAKLAFPTIRKMADKITEKYPNIRIHVYCIRNAFFGETITVSGLLTGRDICGQLTGKNLGEALFLPCNVLKADEDIFLDDMTLTELIDSLQVPVLIIQSEGKDFVNQIIFTEGNHE